MEPDEEGPEALKADSEAEVEALLGVLADEPAPGPAPDLVSRTLRRVRGMLLLRDLVGFATVEALWESLIRRGRASQRREDRPDE